MSIEDAFKNPEGSRLSDEQFRMLMEQRRRERDQSRGLAAFLTLGAFLTTIVVVGILAANGVFGG